MGLTVRHTFVSAKTEQTDPTLVGPNEWNASHTITDNSNILISADYNFTAIQPGGTLTAGITNTITLPTVPPGVNGTDTNHYLYLSGGTGTAESVLITGGSAVSGGTNQTLSFVPANNHSGAWAIGSASTGLQEMWIAASNGNILQTSGALTIHAKVTAPTTGSWMLRGSGLLASFASIVRASDYPNGDLILVSGHSAFVHFESLTITNSTVAAQTSGAAIHILQSSSNFNNVYILGGYEGYKFEAASTVNLNNCNFYTNVTCHAGVHFLGDSGNVPCTDIRWTGGFIYATNATYGVLAEGIDSLVFNSMSFNSGLYSVALAPTASNYIASVSIVGCQFDNSGTTDPNKVSIAIGTPSTGTVGNVIISSCKFEGEHTVASLDAIDINNLLGGAANVFGIGIHSNWIDEYGTCAIAVGANVSDLAVTGNQITNNNTNLGVSNAGGILMFSTISTVRIVNNFIGGTHHLYNIQLPATSTGVIITNNDLATFSSGAIFLPAIPTGAIIEHNRGIDETTGAVASAATFAVPIAPNFTITGTTGITTLTGIWPGKRGTFITTSGVVNFTSGTTIGNTFATTQNVPVNYFVDAGGKMWVH